MIDARLFGYLALAFVLFLIYQAWMQDYSAPSPSSENGQKEIAAADLPSTDFSSVPPVQPQLDSKITDIPYQSSATAAPATTPANLISVVTDVLRLKIDLHGGSIVSAELLEYSVDLEHPEQPVQLFSIDNGFYVAQSGLQAKDAPAPDHYAEYQTPSQQYTLAADSNEIRVPLIWQHTSGVKVSKVFVLKRGAYDMDVLHVVENGSTTPWQGRSYSQLQRSYNDNGKSRFVYTYTGGVIYSPENRYEKISFEDMSDKPLRRSITNGWAAMIQHYFLSAWVPSRDEENGYFSFGVKDSVEPRYVLGLTSPTNSVASGESAEFASKLYVGPKIMNKLSDLAEGLELTVDYGYLTIISRPLFLLLDWVHRYIGNWGWAIIIVTLLIKAVFYKLAEASYRSMANMRRVQPKMLALRERYADDRQRLSQAMMELYKKEKINPLGGCLPMLIQIPVFIALYWVLLESVELRQAPFILWIHDLSIKDPYFVLPVIMGISMYIQQKLNPAPIDPVQAKVFMLLPFVFTVFFAFFPAGLVLYWVVNNVATIAQQWVITRRVLTEK